MVGVFGFRRLVRDIGEAAGLAVSSVSFSWYSPAVVLYFLCSIFDL